MVIANVKLK